MMKIYIGVFALLTLILVSCGSDSRVSNAEDIGPQVMDLLKELGDMSKEDFREYFMSLEEMRDLGKDEEIVKDDMGRNRLTKITKSDLDQERSRSFAGLIEGGSTFGIHWSEIEFEDFAYEVATRKGIKTCSGTLTFKHGSDKFEVRTVSIFDGSGYSLVEVRGPRER